MIGNKQVFKAKIEHCLIFFILIFLMSCSDNKNLLKGNDIFSLKSSTSKSIRFVPLNNLKGYVVIDNSDSLFYSIGYFLSNLSEINRKYTYMPQSDPPTIIDSSMLSEDIFFANRKDFDNDRLRRQNIFFKRMDIGIYKYTFPVDTNNGGLVGVYADSLAVSEESRILKFNAFFENSSPGSFARNIKIIKSIKLEEIKNNNYYNETFYVD